MTSYELLCCFDEVRNTLVSKVEDYVSEKEDIDLRGRKHVNLICVGDEFNSDGITLSAEPIRLYRNVCGNTVFRCNHPNIGELDYELAELSVDEIYNIIMCLQ